jgi:hypothetical protein
MHVSIKFHAYSDIKVYTQTVSRKKNKDYQRFTLNPGNEGSKHHRQSTEDCGKKGSTGWVMHEYTLTEPSCPFLKICHVTFTGHGKCRKRLPDEESDYRAAGEPASNKRPRVAVAAVDNSGPTIFQQEHSLPFPIDKGFSAMAEQQQQQMVMMQLLDDKNDCQAANSSSSTCAYGWTMTVAADQDFGEAHANAGEEPAHDTDEETLEWFRLHGEDLLADGEPTAEQQHGINQQEQLFWRSICVDTENIVC